MHACIFRLAGAAEYTNCFSVKGLIPPTPANKCPDYDTKKSDSKVSVKYELWGMRSTPSVPSLPGPLWPREVAPERVQYIYERKSVNYEHTQQTFFF